MHNCATWIAQAEYGSWFRPYAFFVFVGFIVVMLIAWCRFARRKIPTRALELGFFILVPAGILGASFFGKLDYFKPIPFYELFAFWQPGLSIHGGILVGILVGIIWFRFQGKKTHISLLKYGDLILPNVLVGQGIGRWGNFFNHELLGNPVSKNSVDWLPGFIWHNLFYWLPRKDGGLPNQAIGHNGQGVDPNNFQAVQYHLPIFLIESLCDFALFFIILFLVPYIVKLLSPKPWKKDVTNPKVSLSRFYYVYYYNLEHSTEALANASEVYPLWKDYQKQKKALWRMRDKIKLYVNWKKARGKQLAKQDRHELEKLQNPYHVYVVRSGVSSGLYILLYNFVRFFLELTRRPQDLFIKQLPALDYTVIWIFILIGLGLTLTSQFIAPYKWRTKGWYYEKQY